MIRRSGVTRLLIGGGLLTSVVWFLAGSASAAPAFNLTTSPIAANVPVTPGTSSTTILQVMNNNPDPVQISLELDQFGAHNSSGQAAIFPISPGDPTSSYVHFSQQTLTANPGVWTPVTMKISLPKSASLGYYYAVLFKPILPNPTQKKNTNTIKGSNAVLVLVDTNSANEQRQLQVTSFAVSKKLYQYLPASFSVTVHNNGNIFIPPAGDIFISKSSSFKSTLATLPVNKGGGNVLPETNRVFTSDWSDGFPVYKENIIAGEPVTDKKGKPIQKLKWDFTQLGKFRIGKYYAHLALVYNNGIQDIPVDSVVSFWVIPWKLMLVALAITLLIGFGLFGSGRSIYRRARKVKIPKKNKQAKE